MNFLTKHNTQITRSLSPIPMTIKLLSQRNQNQCQKTETHLDKLKNKIHSISMLRNQNTDRGKIQQSVIVKTNKRINKSISPHPLTFTQFKKTAKIPFLSRNRKEVQLKREITQTNSTLYKTTENFVSKSQLKTNRNNSTPKIQPLNFNNITIQIESIEEYHYNIVKAIQKEKEKVIRFNQLFEDEEEISVIIVEKDKIKQYNVSGRLTHR